MKKLDYRLINITLMSLVLYLGIKSIDFWFFLISKIYNLLIPLIISFMIAYVLHPIFKEISKKLNKKLAMIILIVLILLIVFLFINLIIRVSYDTLNLISLILNFIKTFSFKYSINLDFIENNLNYLFDYIFKNITNNIVFTINFSLSFISSVVIVIISSFYFLYDMDNIRTCFKNFISKFNLFNYFKLLDYELNKYTKGFLYLVLISFFEYSFIYFLVGLPNYLLLGFLAGILNIIPCFGFIISFIISLICSFSISYNLGITVLIINLILSVFDNYIINPYVYGKTNKLNPLVNIISVFIMGKLFNLFGIVISLPISILIITTLKYYKILK